MVRDAVRAKLEEAYATWAQELRGQRLRGIPQSPQ